MHDLMPAPQVTPLPRHAVSNKPPRRLSENGFSGPFSFHPVKAPHGARQSRGLRAPPEDVLEQAPLSRLRTLVSACGQTLSFRPSFEKSTQRTLR